MSDAALWTSVRETLRTAILPALDDPWARSAAIQLVGLADFARSRPPDPTAERAAELAGLLGVEPDAAWEAASRELVERGPKAAEVRAALVRHLDDDLAAHAVLIPAFRGKLPDA